MKTDGRPERESDLSFLASTDTHGVARRPTSSYANALPSPENVLPPPASTGTDAGTGPMFHNPPDGPGALASPSDAKVHIPQAAMDAGPGEADDGIFEDGDNAIAFVKQPPPVERVPFVIGEDNSPVSPVGHVPELSQYTESDEGHGNGRSAGEPAVVTVEDAALPQDLLQSSSQQSDDAPLGMCATEPAIVVAWTLCFHLALFSTFFTLFFQFALRDRYTHSQETLATLLAMLASPEVSPLARNEMRAQIQILSERSRVAFEARKRRNDRSLMISLIPMALFWIVSIVLGVIVRNQGHKILPQIRGAVTLFVAFVICEMLIFVFVVKKYAPLDSQGLVNVYKDAFKTSLGECPQTAGPTTEGRSLPLTAVVDAFLRSGQADDPVPARPWWLMPGETETGAGTRT